MAIGCLLLGICNIYNLDTVYYFSYFCISFGGPILFVSVCSFANFFPEKAGKLQKTYFYPINILFFFFLCQSELMSKDAQEFNVFIIILFEQCITTRKTIKSMSTR